MSIPSGQRAQFAMASQQNTSQSQPPYSTPIPKSPDYDDGEPYTQEKSDNEHPPYEHRHTRYESPSLTSPSRPITGQTTLFNLDAPITLLEYRILVGMSPDPGTLISPPPTDTIYPRLLPYWIRRWWRHEDKEAPTSIYYSVLEQEKLTTFYYRLFEVSVYAAYIIQLILSAALIILGAVPVKHTASIASCGAANGILAGILSLMKGQGLPMRLIKYAESLRVIRDEIEWKERQLRAGLGTVSYRDVFKLRKEYEVARDTEVMNHPDVWQTGTKAATAGPAPTTGGCGETLQARQASQGLGGAGGMDGIGPGLSRAGTMKVPEKAWRV